MGGKLYVVATPIGNLDDVTERAKRVLSAADIIAAEDTRVTQKLLNHLGISCKMISNHKYNERRQQTILLDELIAGKNIAMVSDAGTPCISDPGSILVKAAIECGIEVEGVCGANAVVTALSISGFSFNAFSFYGFLPRTNKEIRDLFESVLKTNIPVAVFFESPNRIKHTVNLLKEIIADSELCVCNDLTKRYEKIYRGTPKDVFEELDINPDYDKGEYTIVVKIPYYFKASASQEASINTLEAKIVEHMIKNNCSMKQAINELATMEKLPKKQLYTASLNLKELL